MDQQRAGALADASALFVGVRRTSAGWRFELIGAGLLLAALLTPASDSAPAAVEPNALLWVVIDVGTTMRCRDLPGDRLQFAKSVATKLIDRWPGLVKLSIFGDEMELLCPATSDVRRMKVVLRTVDADDKPRQRGLQRIVDLWSSVPDAEGFRIVFSDGTGAAPRNAGPLTRAQHTTVVGLGNTNQPSPVPAVGGGWMTQRGLPVESRRDDANLEKLAAALHGSYLPAWPDADGVADKLRDQITFMTPGEEARRGAGLETFQWLVAAALVMFLRPWRWRGAALTALLGAFLGIAGPASAQAKAHDYASARRLLVAGRWADAERAFQTLQWDGEAAVQVQWGLGVALAMEARDASAALKKRELVAQAVASFRNAERAATPLERDDLDWNIAVAKRLLTRKDPSQIQGDPGSGTEMGPEKENASPTEKFQGNPSAERKSGTERGGGAVESPVAGLSIPDPGPMTRTVAESFVDLAAKKAEAAAAPPNGTARRD